MYFGYRPILVTLNVAIGGFTLGVLVRSVNKLGKYPMIQGDQLVILPYNRPLVCCIDGSNLKIMIVSVLG